MDFLDLAKKRYSSRKYLDKKVEKEKIDKILEAANVAPTASNRQPQRIIVLDNEESIKNIEVATKTFGAPLVFVICADLSEAWVRKYDHMNSGEIDASIITTHMMMEATELGLGSVWVCYFEPEELRDALNIPESVEPINILVVGYADDEAKAVDRHSETRKPVEETVYYGKM